MYFNPPVETAPALTMPFWDDHLLSPVVWDGSGGDVLQLETGSLLPVCFTTTTECHLYSSALSTVPVFHLFSFGGSSFMFGFDHLWFLPTLQLLYQRLWFDSPGCWSDISFPRTTRVASQVPAPITHMSATCRGLWESVASPFTGMGELWQVILFLYIAFPFKSGVICSDTWVYCGWFYNVIPIIISVMTSTSPQPQGWANFPQSHVDAVLSGSGCFDLPSTSLDLSGYNQSAQPSLHASFFAQRGDLVESSSTRKNFNPPILLVASH